MDSSEMTDVTDQISEYCPRPSVCENVPIQEVLDDLKCEVRELSKEIVVCGKNDSTYESLNPDRTVMVPERNIMLKRKTLIVNGLRIGMEMMKSTDFPRNVPEAMCTYVTDIDNCVQDIEHCINRKLEQKENAQNRIGLYDFQLFDL